MAAHGRRHRPVASVPASWALSEGFKYTYDPTRPEGDRITGMWLDGVAIDAGTTYSVTVNSFLASGGDNFSAFAEATDKRDTGKVDLQAMVDYMAEFATGRRPARGRLRAARRRRLPASPASYAVGDTVTVDLSSLAMTGTGDVQDAEVEVTFDGEPSASSRSTTPPTRPVTPTATTRPARPR